jgi:Tol biopolymer transport system component
MRRPFWVFLSLFSLLGLVLFLGCGGGSVDTPPTPSPTATPTNIPQDANVALSITWPDPTRFVVPVATQSVRVELRDTKGVVIGTPRIVTRPTTGLVSNITFSDVPAANITVSVAAFPNADATGIVLSTGSLVVAAQSNQTVNAPIVVNSTIASVKINGNDGTNLTVGQTRILTAQAVNSAGETVLVAPSQWEWTSSDTINFGLTVSGQSVTIAANYVGSTTITLRNKESGKTIASSLSTIPNSNGGGGDLSTTKIAFAKKVGNYSNIFIMNGDGTNLKNISNVNAYELSPIFSPDGKKILFVSSRSDIAENHKAEIYIMNTDGANIIQLTTGSPLYADANSMSRFIRPVFSSDSKKIMFTSSSISNPVGSPLGIQIINADGTGQRSLVGAEGGGLADFSPDSKKVVFGKSQDGNGDLYTMNIDGTQLTRLTDTPESETFPIFSPDGKKILFTRSNGKTNGGLYIMNIDGTEQINLDLPGYFNSVPIFSHDSKKIIFRMEEIYTINVNGTQKTKITNNVLSSLDFFVSPDDTKIVYISQVDQFDYVNHNLKMINMDGTQDINITSCTRARYVDSFNNLSWSGFSR